VLKCPSSEGKEETLVRKDILEMSAREVKRIGMIQKAIEKKIVQRKAAELLGVCERQVRRIVRRFREKGPQGLIHQSRGRPSNHKLPKKLKDKVLGLYEEKYPDFGPTFFGEKLLERHKIQVSRETLRHWLIEGELWERQRKVSPHREWREPKECPGEMVQIDGSHHDWLEGRGPKLVLMGYIDDADNNVFARFYDYEGTLPAMDSFYRRSLGHGLPQSVYLDKHSTYKSWGEPTLEEELQGKRPQSQFERALEELEVRVIHANSPQAKGRVERLFRTFQDRLIKEMRLAGIKSREEANRFLRHYLLKYNRRFGRRPRNETDLHRPIPKGVNLKRILCIRERHLLRKDNTLRHDQKFYLIKHSWNGRRPKVIQAEERLDGKLYLLDGDRSLPYREIKERPRVLPKLKRKPLPERAKRIPAPLDHPWKRFKLPGSSENRVSDEKVVRATQGPNLSHLKAIRDTISDQDSIRYAPISGLRKPQNHKHNKNGKRNGHHSPLTK
jgi:transposase